MALFSKEKEEKEVSELPPLPESRSSLEPPKLEKEREMPTLPSLEPKTPPHEEHHEIPRPPISKPIPVHELRASIRPKTLEIEAPKIKTHEIGEPPRDISRKKEPIFVRIDKFEAGLKNFEEIKKELAKIEDDLKGIREIRTKESEELARWEHEISETKEKLNRIDSTIFEKI